MIEIINQDRELFLYLNNLGMPQFDAIWSFISGKFSWVPLYAWLLWLLYKKYTLKSFLYITVALTLAVVVSDQMSNLFKYGFARLRPCHDITLLPHMRRVECGGLYSFYSGHASNTFLLATFLVPLLGKEYRILSILMFVWAAVIAYSRIYLGVHFPLDIFIGAIMGSLVGFIFVSSAKKIMKIQKSEI